MNSSTVDYHKKLTNLRTKILKNEEQRIELDHKLHSLSNIDSRLKQREQIDHIQTYFTQLNQESQHAEQRNLQLLNDISHAEQNLIQLRINTEQVIRLKQDYLHYLESNYPDWQKRISTTNNNNNHTDDHSTSESISHTFSRSKHTNSLRMELSRTGLYFLLKYIENELIDTIDKKKFYQHDPPTITQKRTILDIANQQQTFALKDLDPTTTSMFIIDQLASTIRRTTKYHCLLNENILELNIIDLDKTRITNMLPEQDQSLWIRLIEHFSYLLKYHIMNSDTLANKFAPLLLQTNMLYLHDKAKSLLKHILEKPQQILSDDEDKSSSLQQMIKKNPLIPPPTSSSWLNKLSTGHGIHDDDDTSSSLSLPTTRKDLKSPNSTGTMPRTNIQQDDSDFEFYS